MITNKNKKENAEEAPYHGCGSRKIAVLLYY